MEGTDSLVSVSERVGFDKMKRRVVVTGLGAVTPDREYGG